jgi:hypothetical protein
MPDPPNATGEERRRFSISRERQRGNKKSLDVSGRSENVSERRKLWDL